MSTVVSSDRAPLGALLQLLDRPALSALDLARGSGRALLVPAAVGFGLCTIGAGLADLVTPGPPVAMAGLRALLEAAAVVIPTTVILGTYLRMRVWPKTFLAATGIALLTAGVVGLSMLPLFAFALAAGGADLPWMAQPAVTLPFAFAAAAVLVGVRVLRTLDPSAPGTAVSAGFAVLFLAAFTVRFWPALQLVRQGGF